MVAQTRSRSCSHTSRSPSPAGLSRGPRHRPQGQPSTGRRGRARGLRMIAALAPVLLTIPEATPRDTPQKAESSFSLSMLSSLMPLSNDLSASKSPAMDLSTPPKWWLCLGEPKNPPPASVLPSAPERFTEGSSVRPRPKYALPWRPLMSSPIGLISAPVYTSTQSPDTAMVTTSTSEPSYTPRKKFSPMTGWGKSAVASGSKPRVRVGTGSPSKSIIQELAAAVLASRSSPASASAESPLKWNQDFQTICGAAAERLQVEHVISQGVLGLQTLNIKQAAVWRWPANRITQADADGSAISFADPVMPDDFEEALHAGAHLQNGFDYPDSILGSPRLSVDVPSAVAIGASVILNTIFRWLERDMLFGIFERINAEAFRIDLLPSITSVLPKPSEQHDLPSQISSNSPSSSKPTVAAPELQPQPRPRATFADLKALLGAPSAVEAKAEGSKLKPSLGVASVVPKSTPIKHISIIELSDSSDSDSALGMQPKLRKRRREVVLSDTPDASDAPDVNKLSAPPPGFSAPYSQRCRQTFGEDTDDNADESFESSKSFIKVSSKIQQNPCRKLKKLNNGNGQEMGATATTTPASATALLFPSSPSSPSVQVAWKGKGRAVDADPSMRLQDHFERCLTACQRLF
ncbi:hypothetical protein BDP27DRAFT_1431865 [Rhodocollybia butyracea]|uniref:Uncharacterized protein n=1 Tax=Rhodocollybia butyracea TaxID=206335 RepID=A0A9P5TX45_9AGAR|nr:hypothetical protein BDP27DRAFT_1431865 [Rhodocollybia butyracea]